MTSRRRGWSNGFERDSNFVRCFIPLSWMTSCTVRMPRSLWIILLVTYHGASTIAVNILDWPFCMTAILDLQAQPHNSMPYVHIRVIMDLYSRSLLSTERWDILPSNQYSSLCRRSVLVSWWYDPTSSAYCPSAIRDILLLQLGVFLHYLNRLVGWDRYCW